MMRIELLARDELVDRLVAPEQLERELAVAARRRARRTSASSRSTPSGVRFRVTESGAAPSSRRRCTPASSRSQGPLRPACCASTAKTPASRLSVGDPARLGLVEPRRPRRRRRAASMPGTIGRRSSGCDRSPHLLLDPDRPDAEGVDGRLRIADVVAEVEHVDGRSRAPVSGGRILPTRGSRLEERRRHDERRPPLAKRLADECV